jgi:hypothetical protein
MIVLVGGGILSARRHETAVSETIAIVRKRETIR